MDTSDVPDPLLPILSAFMCMNRLFPLSEEETKASQVCVDHRQSQSWASCWGNLVSAPILVTCNCYAVVLPMKGKQVKGLFFNSERAVFELLPIPPSSDLLLDFLISSPSSFHCLPVGLLLAALTL